MLEYLRIQNLAILELVELDLAPGLNVLTGETGAGKSILVGALAALRGARLERDALRDGADQGGVEAVFRLDAEPEPLLASRVLTAAGRSRQRLAGELVTATQLAERISGLIDIASQHDGQMLTDPSRHRSLLDAAGVAAETRAAVADAVGTLQTLAARLRSLSTDERERAARLDLLDFQLGELAALDPRPGEEPELEAERRRLAAAADLERLAREALGLIYEDEGAATERVARGARLLGEAAAFDPRLSELVARLEELRATLDDAARDLSRYADGVEGDPARLAVVDERLGDYARLARKHRVEADGLAELRDRLAAEARSLRSADASLETLGAEIAAARKVAARAAERLHAERQRAAEALAKAVAAHLHRLGMPKARFLVRIEPLPSRRNDDPELVFDGRHLGRDGWDRVEFLVAPNPGEEPLPLARTASGGELSRIMLALKLVLAERDPVDTYVFDEVDAGIGGVTADTVGRALAEVARHRQVLCITHLPQIAAYADRHFRVAKAEQGGRTVASFATLSEPERTEEIARMLGGATVTKATRAAAAELVAGARGAARGRARRPRRASDDQP